jgi:hypothetical protein
MELFLGEGDSYYYDDESIIDVEVPLRYKHMMIPWVPNELPQLEIDFCVNEMIYHIAPSSIHGMEYVKPCYNYGYWLRLV